MISGVMHTFVGFFNLNKPADGYKVNMMLLFGKQAAAVSDTMQVQNKCQENTDCIKNSQKNQETK